MQVLLLLWIAGVQFSTNFIKVHGNNIVIDCPAVRDGDVSTFGGTLYKANISSVCDVLVPIKVAFLLTYPSTVVEVLCEQQLSPCNTAENNQGCRCVSEGADAYTFEFNFRFNKSKHEGSTLTITTDCFGTIPYGLTSSDPCDLKEVSPPTPDQARPSADPSISCKGTQGQYVPENADLYCYCSASDLGQPKGRLRVYRDSVLTVSGSYGNGNETFTIQGVTRRDNGAVFKCVLDWTTPDGQDRDTSYTVHVAYGPDTVNISDPGAFDLHPTSPSPLTLTCSASQSNPGVTYSWSGACARSTSSTCSFTPTTSNNNDVITCTVTNSVTGTGPSPASRTLRIHYPPTSPPVITGYGGEPMYQGATRDFTCTVTGGNPPVAAVTFTCGGQGQEVSGTSRTITVTADRSNHGSTCTCRARWKTYNPGWYTQTADVTLTVFYPPQLPSISHKNQDYPFMAGQAATLYCSFNPGTDRGNPPATLTWRGHAGSSGQGEVSLALTQLSSSDNGRREVCEARNNFTDHNNTPVTRQTVIDVYYVAEISVFIANNHTNNLTVNETDPVTFKCTAAGRPTPAMRIVKNGQRVADRPRGQVNPEDTATLVHRVSRAECSEAGRYGCQLLDNDNPAGHEENVTLLVNCGPRASGPAPPSVNYEGRPMHLSLHLLAFPLPHTFRFYFHGPANNVSEAVVRDQLQIDCWNTFAAYAVTYNITFDKVGAAEAGYYSVQMQNDFGLETVVFEIAYYERDVSISGTPGASSNGLSAGATVGVTVAVMLVGVAASVVWMWRRQWVLPCASNVDTGESGGPPDGHHRPTPAGVDETGGQQDISLYEIQDSSVQGDPPVPSDYEHLKIQDAGMRSVYSGLSPYVNTRHDADKAAGPIYENS